MTRKQVWQYKCEYCGKKGYAAGHMKGHERGCTLNPDRECRMCKWLGIETPTPQSEILEALMERNSLLVMTNERGHSSKYIFEELYKVAQECPMCFLTAVRIINSWAGWDGVAVLDWNFKEELTIALERGRELHHGFRGDYPNGCNPS